VLDAAPLLDIDLTLPRRVVVRQGAVAELAAHLEGRGSVLLVTSPSVRDRALDAVGPASVVDCIEVSGEPTLAGLTRAIAAARARTPDVVVGIGGGSVLDAAKVLAAMVPNQGDLAEHLEVARDPAPLRHDPLPVVAAPTTFGTGSEMTHNAVVRLPDAGRKVSLRDRRLTPVLSLVDPDLGRAVPLPVQRDAAFDAVVQLVEAAATPLGNDATRAVALTGARHALPALRALVEEGSGDEVRRGLALGAACSGVALANAKLGTVHGFAGVIGGIAPVGHGRLCALFAAPVLRATIDALRQRSTAADQAVLQAYGELARLLRRPGATSDPVEEAVHHAADLPQRLADLVAAAGIDATGLAPVLERGADDVVTAVRAASSTRGNPVDLTDQVLRRVLEEVLA
jgi:alcohol dehydrogenase class IV